MSPKAIVPPCRYDDSVVVRYVSAEVLSLKDSVVDSGSDCRFSIRPVVNSTIPRAHKASPRVSNAPCNMKYSSVCNAMLYVVSQCRKFFSEIDEYILKQSYKILNVFTHNISYVHIF